MFMQINILVTTHFRLQKINYTGMFLRHFFQKKMREGDFFFYFFLSFVNKNDVPMMFRKKFRLLISGANHESRCTRIQPTKQPYVPVSKANGGQTELIIHDVLTICHINYLECNKKF